MLAGSSVYLAGPIEHTDDATSWRDAITPRLLEFGVRVYNPLIKPNWVPGKDINTGEAQRSMKDLVLDGDERAVEINNSIRLAGRRLAATADFIICYLPKVLTYGTFEELSIGSNDGKPVLFICPDADFPPSSWLLDQFISESETWSDVFFENMDNLLQWLFEVHNSNRSYDSYKWIFLDWPTGEQL